jgi:hypothetical protein
MGKFGENTMEIVFIGIKQVGVIMVLLLSQNEIFSIAEVALPFAL